MKRVLYVCHNHRSVVPGGVETYALELYQGMRRSASFEPIMLSRIGPPYTGPSPIHRGTYTSAVGHDPHQYLIYSDLSDFDWLMMTPRRKGSLRYYRDFLEAYQPDVVHFQHTLFLGFDFITETRRTLPRAPIVHTLHEYMPICHRDGQMVMVSTGEPCMEATPQRCHGCFPEIPASDFFLRKRFISMHLSNVDLFIAPSRFLMERFIEWGIPRDKIRFEEHGRLPMQPANGARLQTASPAENPARHRLGFFGQLTEFKGVDLLLDAMQMLGADPELQGARAPHLWIHGANLDLAGDSFKRRFLAMMEGGRPNVTLVGPYDHARLPALMAGVDWVVVPSTWWENAPLVIQEAFAHGRPVICSDIGGMAEKVSHGVDGLHFRAKDVTSLTDAIKTATTTPRLWETLHRGIAPVYSMDDHVAAVERLYQGLLVQ